MQIKLLRNATLQLEYGGKTFLIDPFLADQGSMPPFPSTPNQHMKNPTASLPVSAEETVSADAVIVTHLHADHFDETAKKMLNKMTPLFAQNESDAEVIRSEGFQNVHSLEDKKDFHGIEVIRTNGQHGHGEITKRTGVVSGVVFKHPSEKTLYLAGDTVWCQDVKEAIDSHNPDVIVVNGGAAQFLEGGPITMTKEDIYETSEASNGAALMVVHMESLNHCLLSRNELKTFIQNKKTKGPVFIPDDGEILTF